MYPLECPFRCHYLRTLSSRKGVSSRITLRAVGPNWLVHIDLWGPARTATIGQARYLLTCHDDYSRRTQIFFLRKKSDALGAFASYIKLVENHCQTTVKTVRSDNGGEFTSHRFASLLAQNGIEPMPIPPDAHAQNGRVERQHLTIFNDVRTLLIHSGLPDKFWGEAAAYSVHLRNHLPLPNSTETPMSLWTGRPGTPLKMFQPFGSTIFVRDHRQTDKLKPRFVRAILLGWQPLSDSIVKYWHKETNTFAFSRDVHFGPSAPSDEQLNRLTHIPSTTPVPVDVPVPTPPSASPAAELSGDSSTDKLLDDSGDQLAAAENPASTSDAASADEDMVDNQLTVDDASQDPPIDSASPSPTALAPLKPKPKDRKGVSWVTVPVDEEGDKDEDAPTSYINEEGRRVMPKKEDSGQSQFRRRFRFHSRNDHRGTTSSSPRSCRHPESYHVPAGPSIRRLD